MISKRKLTLFIGLMLMVSSLLMVVADNIPIIASFKWLWGPVSLLYVALSTPKIYLSKEVFNAFLYGFLFCFLLQFSLWYSMHDWYKISILKDFYAMFVVVVFYAHLRAGRYYSLWQNIAFYAMFFMIITGLLTLYALYLDPVVVRLSYSYRDTIDPYLLRLGIGSYGYMTAIVALLPFFVFKSKRVNKKISIYYYLLILFLFFVLVRSQIFTNIIVAAITILLSFAGRKYLKKTILIFSVISVLVFVIPKEFYARALHFISQSFDPESNVFFKLNDLSNFILNPEIGSSTGVGSRAERFPWLWQAFLNRPLLGDASDISWDINKVMQGGHLYWISRLTIWGILGFSTYLLLLISIFSTVMIQFDKEFKFYYLLSLLAIFTIGIFKNLGGREIYIVLLIIIPGLYYSHKVNNHNVFYEQQ